MTNKMVRVVWIDSASQSGWVGHRDAKRSRPVKINSVGYLVKKTDTRIVIAMSDGAFGKGDVLVVPASCVKSIEKLKTK